MYQQRINFLFNTSAIRSGSRLKSVELGWNLLRLLMFAICENDINEYQFGLGIGLGLGWVELKATP